MAPLDNPSPPTAEASRPSVTPAGPSQGGPRASPSSLTQLRVIPKANQAGLLPYSEAMPLPTTLVSVPGPCLTSLITHLPSPKAVLST